MATSSKDGKTIVRDTDATIVREMDAKLLVQGESNFEMGKLKLLMQQRGVLQLEWRNKGGHGRLRLNCTVGYEHQLGRANEDNRVFIFKTWSRSGDNKRRMYKLRLSNQYDVNLLASLWNISARVEPAENALAITRKQQPKQPKESAYLASISEVVSSKDNKENAPVLVVETKHEAVQHKDDDNSKENDLVVDTKKREQAEEDYILHSPFEEDETQDAGDGYMFDESQAY
jgi:hypothetical protein